MFQGNENGVVMRRERTLEFISEDRPCSYLDGPTSKIRYRLIEHCSTLAYQNMIEHGWRRFGKLFFTPVCQGCNACLSLRIDVNRFHRSRNLKRVENRNAATRIVIQRPSLTTEHFNLYRRYHQDMHVRRGWEQEVTTPYDYYQAFVEGHEEYGFEILYYRGHRLIGVALSDILPQAVSAVYFYYDPMYRHLSPGVFSVLTQVNIAKERGIPYIYLGYWVKENISLSYKSRYQPHEILQGRPALDEPAYWVSPDVFSGL